MGEQGNPAFNQTLLKRFVNLMGLFPVGNLVRLNTDELAVVTAEHPERSVPPAGEDHLDRRGDDARGAAARQHLGARRRGEHPRAVVEAVDPESSDIDPLKYL